MMSLLKTHRALLLASILFVSMGLGFWFGIRPLYEKIEAKRDSIQMQYAGRENRNRQIARLPDLEASYDMIVADEGRMDILLTEPRVVDFVRTVEALGRETNTEVKIEANEAELVAPKKKTNKEAAADAAEQDESKKTEPEKLLVESLPFPEYLRLKITVRGEYPDLVNFLAKMETLPIALDVVALEMRNRSTEEDNQSAPAPSRTNPFTLVPGDNQIVETAPEEGEVATPPQASQITKSQEAVLDTLVYVDKGK